MPLWNIRCALYRKLLISYFILILFSIILVATLLYPFPANSKLWISIVLIMVGMITAFFLAGKIYRHYSMLDSQLARLEHALEQAVPVIQESYLRKLLNSSVQIPTQHTDLIQWSRFKEKYFCAIVIKIDNQKQFSTRTSKEQELIRFAIMNIAEDKLGQLTAHNSLIVEHDLFVAISQLDQATLSEDFLRTWSDLQEIIHQYYHITISIGVGDIVHSYEAIQHSYRSAREYLKYQLFLGHESIIHRSIIEKQLHLTGEYPTNIESALLKAINIGKITEVDHEIQRFLEVIKQRNYPLALHYIRQLIVTIQKHFNNDFVYAAEESETHRALLFSLEDFETIEEISNALKSLCHTIIDHNIEEQNNRHYMLIKNVQKLIHQHYKEPYFSQEWLADQMHYSSGYLGKLFKQFTQQSFNDYVNQLRLKEAIHLLKTTDASAIDISEKIGIRNCTYFFTLFKKSHGMTPGQYRAKYHSVL